MSALQKYSLQAVQQRLDENCLPFRGITELGSCEFKFLKPCFYIGIVMHAGSRVRPGVIDNLRVSKQDQFREEDPYMESFITDFPFQIIARDSRFEYDLNRDTYEAVYPFDKPKYGLKVWKREWTDDELRESTGKHQEFHDLVNMAIGYMLKQNRYALVFDMHSYCYQREERKSWYLDPGPGINLGTKAVNRELFGEMIDSYLKELGGLEIGGHQVRVAENEIFMGGYLSRRLSKEWFDQVLVLALEYKKIFMDEWSGEVYRDVLDKLVSRFIASSDNLVRSSRIPGSYKP